MSIQRDYIELKATIGQSQVTKRFKALVRDYAEAKVRVKNIQQSVTGDTLITRSPVTLETVQAVLYIKATPDAGYGSWDDLVNFYAADDLEYKLPTSDSFVKGEIINELSYRPLDPRGQLVLVPITIQERTQ